MKGELVRDEAIEMPLLQESEQKYRWMVENANAAIIIVQDRRLKFFNDKTLEVTGYTSQELTAQSFAEFIHPEDRERVIEHHLRRLRGEPAPSVYAFRMVHKTGEIKWVETHIVLISWEGKPAALSFLTDITERRQMEQALRESEERFSRFSEATFEGIGIIDGDALIDANPQLARMLGYDLAEIVGQNLMSFIAPESQDLVQSHNSSGYEGAYEFLALRQDGSTFPVEAYVKIMSSIGRTVKVVALRDITRRKQVEAEIRRRNRELAVFNRIIAASAATPGQDQEVILEVACRELALALNVPHATAALLDSMKTTSTIVAEYAAEEGLAILRRAWSVIDDPLSQYLLSHKTPLVIDKDQNNLYLGLIPKHLRPRGIASLLLVPLMIEGEVVGTLGVASLEPRRFSTEDLNLAWSVADQLAGVLARVRLEEKQRQLEAQYYQAQKMEAVGRLTAGVAHDFNNLLTTINGFAALIQTELRPDAPPWEMAGVILRSGQRAAGLVRQLLAFSRKQLIQPQVLNLNSIVVELDKMLQRVIGEDIDLKIHLAAELWPVKADPAQMEQVILNLVVNARDAMPTGGQLTLETANVVIDDQYVAGHLDTRPGQYVLLAISDTGYGMSQEVKAHIFEPFFTTKELGRGTGLGLATVFGIVKQSGGDIWVYSEEGVGTTFKIYFPSVAEKKSEPPLDPEVGVEIPVGSETILLVEDDAGVRALLRQVLSPLGYTLLEAGNGQEALRLLADYPDPIHLLLTDVVMPGISGKTLAEEASRARPDLKTLFMSGYTDEAIIQHDVLDSGVAFIQKPFNPMSLAVKLRSVLER